ncbi:hypothetical protein [Paenibacillus thermotolerans]|uniref:hypothetical protein n=1 Tax=Paenibacillus thermotolerans TaxID=3027807 RepID=UPI002367CA1C|nr:MULTISPECIES: hypothetical protein [unclassified Paenibacillus]
MTIKKVTSCMLAALVLLASGCSSVAREPAEHAPDREAAFDSEQSKDEAETAPKLNQAVELDHLRIRVDSEWTVLEGADSVAFKSGDNTVGGIDGLGYADSVDSLVPNHSIVKDSKELQGLPVKAVQVITTDDVNGSESEDAPETMHIFLFLEEQKVVYDIRFDPASVDEQYALEIVKTAEIK